MKIKLLIFVIVFSVPQVYSEKIATYLFNDDKDSVRYISNCQELSDMRLDLNVNYVLKNDIDCSDFENFSPVGDGARPFKGSLDGNHHTISNLTLKNNTEKPYLGLFGNVESAKIENLKLNSFYLQGSEEYIGTLAGEMGWSLINNVMVENTYIEAVSLSAEIWDHVGGLIGESNYNLIVDSGVIHSIIKTNDYMMTGGVVGATFTTEIRDSFSNENHITTRGSKGAVGGFIGYHSNPSVITNSSASNLVEGCYSVGGLVGLNASNIQHSYSTGIVKGGDVIGGLVGSSDMGKIDRSYSLATVIGKNGIGGLVGSLFFTTVIDSYSLANVKGDKRVGGLVGVVFIYAEEEMIKNTYSAGKVIAESDNKAGGLIGEFKHRKPEYVVTSVWDINTTNQRQSEGGEGKLTAEMKRENTYISLGWDFEEVWSINENINNGYPYLK